MVTSLLVSRYNISFAPGEEGTNLFNDLKDMFITTPGKLRLVFSERD